VDSTNVEATAPHDSDSVLELFGRITDDCARILRSNSDWALSGRRASQYRIDVLLDDACVPPLLASGFGVLSEETGLQLPDVSTDAVVVVDPLDGSTNASLGLPWCNTALCLTVEGEPTVAMVTNLVTGERYQAVRGGGATRDGAPITVGHAVPLSDAMIAINDVPARRWGWRQYRAMGSSALDICTVAAGAFDGYVDMGPGHHGVWDYLAAVLVLQEAGGVAADIHGRELGVLDPEELRGPVAAGSEELLEELLVERRRDG
jgi:myo-inositol-1(or 4)-monophosphatase